MQPVVLFLFLALFASSTLSDESAENVHVSGSFRVSGDGNQVYGTQQDHPFFQLEGMKIARAYLDRQYAQERAQQEQQFEV